MPFTVFVRKCTTSLVHSSYYWVRIPLSFSLFVSVWVVFSVSSSATLSGNSFESRVNFLPTYESIEKRTTMVRTETVRNLKQTSFEYDAGTGTTSTANDDKSAGNDPRPKNLRLAFLGDSVTRYQYVSLAYFLKTGQWFEDEQDPNILFSGGFADWNKYLESSNTVLKPEEQCDCYRASRGQTYYWIKENRYFADPVRNNYLSFVTKFGKASAHGDFDASEVYMDHGVLDTSSAANRNITGYKWEYDWADSIRDHFGKIKPKPDYLVFNAGLHSHDLEKAAVQERIAAALNDTGIIGIYKTTSYPKTNTHPRQFSRSRHDKKLCGKVFSNCIDMTWTAQLTGKEHYSDSNHFKPHGNTLMNQQLLSYLATFHQEPLDGSIRGGGRSIKLNATASILQRQVVTIEN